MSCHWSKLYKYWFVWNNTLDKKISVCAIFFYASAIRIVKVDEESK